MKEESSTSIGSILPDTRSFEEVYGKCNHKDTMVVGMIDYGTCSLSNLQPCNESILDGIRVIFKKDKRKEAVEYCAKVKALGYKVFGTACFNYKL